MTLLLEGDATMEDFGIYALFGVNGPPQRLLRYVRRVML